MPISAIGATPPASWAKQQKRNKLKPKKNPQQGFSVDAYEENGCPGCGQRGVFDISHECFGQHYKRCEGCLTYWDPDGNVVAVEDVPDDTR